MTKRRAGVVAASIGLLAVGIMALHGTTSAPASGATPADETVDDVPRTSQPDGASRQLMNALTTLTGSIEALQGRIERLENKNDEDTQDEPQENTGKARDRSVDEEKAEALKRLDDIEESFEAEPRDTTWAKEMESTLHTAFAAGNFAGTRTIETGCRSTFCRMAVEHESAESSLQFELIKRQIPGSYYIQHLDADASGRSKSVAFFLRQGAERQNVIGRMMGGYGPPEP